MSRPRPSRVLAEHRAEIAERAKKHGATLVQVFGSVARGEDRPGSDLDLLVTLEEGTSLFDLAVLQADLEDLLGISVDVVSAGGLGPRHEQILREAVPL